MNYTNLFGIWQAVFFKSAAANLISMGLHNVSVHQLSNLTEGRATIHAPNYNRTQKALFIWVWECWTTGVNPDVTPIEIRTTGLGDFTLSFMKSYYPKSNSLEDMIVQLNKIV